MVDSRGGGLLPPRRVFIVRIELLAEIAVALLLAVAFSPFWLALLLLPIIDFAIRPARQRKQLLGLTR